jgi:K+-transporting ATPase A subunit
MLVAIIIVVTWLLYLPVAMLGPGAEHLGMP